MKYQRRKIFKEYRKAGIPFMAAHRLSKLKSKMALPWDVEKELAKEGVTVETKTYCKCCGPEALILHFKGKSVAISYYTLDVVT